MSYKTLFLFPGVFLGRLCDDMCSLVSMPDQSRYYDVAGEAAPFRGVQEKFEGVGRGFDSGWIIAVPEHRFYDGSLLHDVVVRSSSPFARTVRVIIWIPF